MESRIHRTAIVSSEAFLDKGVEIGPYCVIGPGVRVGSGTRLGSHVVLERDVHLGRDNRIKPHAVIGSDAQDLSYKGEPALVVIGDRNVIGEFCMMSRGSHDERITRVGSDNLIMSGVHLGHDAQVGNHCILSNYAQIAGHCEIGDRAVIGGLAAFHQFCRIGTCSMVGGTAGVMQDVPPYCVVQGAPPATVRGLNRVGIRRAGIGEEGFSGLKHAFRLLFRRGMTRDNALEEIERLVPLTPEVRHFVEFCRTNSRRGICKSETPAALNVVGSKPTANEGGSEQQSAAGGTGN
jgi:UDP-N-acetylglucosamine acyltransferase